MLTPVTAAPEPGTLQRWAWDYVTSTSLAHKQAPPPRPERVERDPPARRIEAPGRPVELAPVPPRSRPSRGGLRDRRRRAERVHTFFHHELQATELIAWALLAFPEAPPEFQRGVVREIGDELRHMGLYASHLERLGFEVGSFGVRDWFWERVPAARTALEFVAILGIGFEGGNLDHSARFAGLFREAGDEEGARIQEQIGAEEVAHVRFARLWFERWAGPLTLERWAELLPPPLTPKVMRGRRLDRESRRRAGMSEAFLDALESYERGGAVPG